MASEIQPTLVRPTDNHRELNQGRSCRKMVTTLVALVAIGALTLALLSYFGVIGTGQVGTICFFTTAVVAFVGCVIATALSCKNTRPVPQEQVRIQIVQDEVVLTNSQGIETRKPILNIPQDRRYAIRIKNPKEVPQLTENRPEYVLVRDADNGIWPIYSEVTAEEQLDTRSATKASLREGDDAWRDIRPNDLCSHLDWVEIIPTPDCFWQNKGYSPAFIPALIHWEDNPNERYYYSISNEQVSILGPLDGFKEQYRIENSFFLHSSLPDTSDAPLAGQVAALRAGHRIEFYRWNNGAWTEVPWSIAAAALKEGLTIEDEQLPESRSTSRSSDRSSPGLMYTEFVNGKVPLSITFQGTADHCQIQEIGKDAVPITVPVIRFIEGTSVVEIFTRIPSSDTANNEFAIVLVGQSIQVYSNHQGERTLQPLEELANVLERCQPLKTQVS